MLSVCMSVMDVFFWQSGSVVLCLELLTVLSVRKSFLDVFFWQSGSVVLCLELLTVLSVCMSIMDVIHFRLVVLLENTWAVQASTKYYLYVQICPSCYSTTIPDATNYGFGPASLLGLVCQARPYRSAKRRVLRSSRA